MTSTREMIEQPHCAQDNKKTWVSETGVTDGLPPWAMALESRLLAETPEEKKGIVLARLDSVRAEFTLVTSPVVGEEVYVTSTRKMIEQLHCAQDNKKTWVSETGVADGLPPWALALKSQLLAGTPEEEKGAVLARLDSVLAEFKKDFILEQERALKYVSDLKAELATRPHIPRPAQERRKRQKNAQKFRGQGKSKSR